MAVLCGSQVGYGIKIVGDGQRVVHESSVLSVIAADGKFTWSRTELHDTSRGHGFFCRGHLCECDPSVRSRSYATFASATHPTFALQESRSSPARAYDSAPADTVHHCFVCVGQANTWVNTVNIPYIQLDTVQSKTVVA